MIWLETINLMYKYWGYGLNITSEINFPELLEHDFSIPDVEYIIGKVPDKIIGTSISLKKFSYTVNERELLFKANDVASYYAFDGLKVIIEPFEPIEDKREIRLYVLATVMAAILLHRRMLPVHASAIKQNDKLVLITGQSHAGKSTVLAGLLKKSYTVFSDDVVVMNKDKENSSTLAAASYPMIKLWDDTMDKLDDPSFGDRSFRIQKDIDKYGFFFHGNFDKERYPIEKIFILNIENIHDLKTRKLTGKEAFKSLIEQIYRPTLIQSNEIRLLCFTLMSDLVKNCDITEICRPVECNSDKLVDYVESLL